MWNAPNPEVVQLIDAAKRAYARGDRVNAAAFARQALLRWPGEAAALQILGVVALDAGDFAVARRHLEAANSTQTNALTFNLIGVAADRVRLGCRSKREQFRQVGPLNEEHQALT